MSTMQAFQFLVCKFGNSVAGWDVFAPKSGSWSFCGPCAAETSSACSGTSPSPPPCRTSVAAPERAGLFSALRAVSSSIPCVPTKTNTHPVPDTEMSIQDKDSREESLLELFDGKPLPSRHKEDDEDWLLRGRHDDGDEDFDDEALLLQSRESKRRGCLRRVWDFFRSHWRPQVLAVLWILFLAEAARGIVLPTLSTYVKEVGGSKSDLGLAISLFSVGRLVGAPVLGWWYNKRTALEVMTVALIVGIGGSIMYSFAAVGGLYILLISRVIIGFSTGTLSVARAHIAAQTTKDERTKFMGYAGAVQFIGFGLMPGVTIIFADIDVNIGSMPLNSLTSPGFVIAALSLLAIGLNFLLFSPLVAPTPADDRITQVVHNGDVQDSRGRAEEKKTSMEDVFPEPEEPRGSAKWQFWKWSRETKLMVVGACVFILLNFVARGVLSLLETLGTPLFLEVFEGTTTTEASHFYLILGVLGLSVYLGLGFARKVASEFTMLVFGFILIGAGLITIAAVERDDLNKIQFVAGCVLVLSLGSPIVQTVILSSFSTVLGSQPQGTLMGFITMAGSVGRIVFPLLISLLDEQGSFIVGGVMSAVCIVGVISYSVWVRCASRSPSYRFVVGFPEPIHAR